MQRAGCSPRLSRSRSSERRSSIRLTGQALALALVVFGVLLRPNALLAAPILAAYIVWLSRVSLRKTAILYIPAAIGFFGIVQLVYYGMLDAKRQHPLQTIMIFDLGGISHFAKAEPVSGRLERVGERDAAQQHATSRRCGTFIGGSSRAIS